jgi:hypothetical protein
MTGYLARLKAKIQEKPKPHELSKLPKATFDSFGSDRGRRVFGFDKRPEPDPAEFEERKAMASDSVPERYVDAWARFQLQCPGGVTEQAWRQAIDDAGRFLAQWGALADSFGWLPGDLFDVPRDGIQGGLAWFLEGEAVRSLGPEHAVMQSGRVFDRLKNNQRKSNACSLGRRAEARSELAHSTRPFAAGRGMGFGDPLELSLFGQGSRIRLDIGGYDASPLRLASP